MPIDRVLTWHLGESVQAGSSKGPVYRLDQDYRPKGATIYIKAAPAAADIVFDINVDDVSIFESSNRPRVTYGNKQVRVLNFNTERLVKDAIVTLDIDS